jgi:hypothetical protein
MSRTNPSTNGAGTTPVAPETADGAKGRDSKGRFTRGNKGGPGNPFAASVAKLRQAALEIVTPQEIQGVFRVLLLRAQTGHLASIKLLLAYTIGQPAATVDPDEIDLPDEPPPPPVIEEEEEEEDDFGEPEVAPEVPGPAKVQSVLQALAAALHEVPQEVRDDLARQFSAGADALPDVQSAPREQPTSKQSRQAAGSRTQPPRPTEPPRQSGPGEPLRRAGDEPTRPRRSGVQPDGGPADGTPNARGNTRNDPARPSDNGGP